MAQLAIAWAASRDDLVIPLVGTRRRSRLTEALAALAVELTEDDLREIEMAVPAGSAAGDRYAPEQLAQLDSER